MKGRRIQRTKTAPLPTQANQEPQPLEVLSIQERLRRLRAQQQADEQPRGGGGGGRRRGSRSEATGEREEKAEAKQDELSKLSLSDKRKLFTSGNSGRPTRRKTQPVRLEDLIRAEEITQENLSQEENRPPKPASVLVRTWERRVSMSEMDEEKKDEAAHGTSEADESTKNVVQRRRASRSILQRVQSFQDGGSSASRDGEESDSKVRVEETTAAEGEVEPKVNVRQLSAAFSTESRGNWVKNDAIARRVSKKLETRYSAVFASDLGAADKEEQPQEPERTDKEEAAPASAHQKQEEEQPKSRPKPRKYGARQSTQPITKLEMEDLGVCQSQSIKERFKSIQTSSEGWKNRLSKAESPDKVMTEIRTSPPKRGEPGILENRKSKLEDSQNIWRDRIGDKDVSRVRASTVLESRLSQLENSQQSWKERVEEKDTRQFTVEGKIQTEGSPAVVRRNTRLVRGSPRAKSVHDKPSVDDDGDSLKSRTPVARRIRIDSEATSEQDAEEMQKERERKEEKEKEEAAAKEKESREKAEREKRIVALPSFDDPEVDLFLSPSKGVDQLLPSNEDSLPEVLAPEDLDSVGGASRKLTGPARTVRPPGRRRTQGNPVRRKNERTDIFVWEFEEISTGAAERERRRLDVEAQASETKAAALASRENLENAVVKLRKVEAGDGASPRPQSMMGEHFPFKSPMLLLVKGQRQVQVRLVAPNVSSVNSGDCFLLVTTQRVFVWLGKFSNKMEQSRAKDLATLIVARRDLGFGGRSALAEIEESRPVNEAARSFWTALGCQTVPSNVSPPVLDEDIWFEVEVIKTNMAFVLKGDELEPLEDSWGHSLKKEILKSDQAYVFDFGSEVYVWLGQQVSQEDRKKALRLGQVLFNEGFDYTTCALNPLFPLENDEEVTFKSDKRPEWALFGRITQNMETLLFKAKFFDWPDTGSIGKTKSSDKDNVEQDLDLEQLSFQPPSVHDLLDSNTPAGRLELESANVERGGQWTEVRDGLRQKFTVDTQSVRMWRSSDGEKREVEEEELGQFWRGGTFVVRWHYRIHVGDRRESSNSRNSGLGRERYAYFYWLGAESKVTDQGASALLTVELDKEKGAQVRVLEGKEPAAFLRLFPVLTIHDGRSEDAKPKRCLFIVRGVLPEEGHLWEVPLSPKSLRSRACFLLLDRKGHHRLWLGRAASETSKEVARHVTGLLHDKTPAAYGLSEAGLQGVQEVEEGEENAAFWRQVGGARESAENSEDSGGLSLRAWRLTSSKDRLESGGRERLLTGELYSPQHLPSRPCGLPLLQEDLFSLQQPALVLLDGGRPDMVFLWHGWWPRSKELPANRKSTQPQTLRISEGDSALPEEVEEPQEVLSRPRIAGSARERFARERLAALHTASEFGRAAYGRATSCRCCYAGLEPECFQQLFPMWRARPEVAESSAEEGRDKGQMEEADALLRKFRSQRFPLSRLQERPHPEGCDPLWLERYLDDEEFQKCFKMDRAAYLKLPSWKRNELKKDAQLF